MMRGVANTNLAGANKMDIERLQKLARREGNVSETMAFRLPPEDKQAFIDRCDELELSVGKVLRLLVSDFIRGSKND